MDAETESAFGGSGTEPEANVGSTTSTVCGINKDDFQYFCREGRLVGTESNARAVRFLEESLSSRGYEAHTYVNRRSAILPMASAAGLTILGIAHVLLTGGGTTPALVAMMLGPFVRSAYCMLKGTPLAVFGVRRTEANNSTDNSINNSAPVEYPANEVGESTLVNDCNPPAVEPPKDAPTIVIGAHFDTTSAWFAGSFVTQFLRMLLFAMACVIVSDLISPWAAVIAAAIGGYYIFGNASPGGDDNASGVFTVLDCIDRLSDATGANIVPVFFNFEEEGLFGSKAFAGHILSKKTGGIPGVSVDPKAAYMVNFDCVGRGKRIFVSGNKGLVDAVLATHAGQELGASRTSYYASDHLMFRRPWQAISFARANKFWMLSLEWLHSKADVPDKVNLGYVEEVARIAEEWVRGIVAERFL